MPIQQVKAMTPGSSGVNSITLSPADSGARSFSEGMTSSLLQPVSLSGSAWSVQITGMPTFTVRGW